MKVKVISLPYIFQVLCFTRPRYQVSVYRTIGPLVLYIISLYATINAMNSFQDINAFCKKEVTMQTNQIKQSLQVDDTVGDNTSVHACDLTPSRAFNC